MKTIFSQNFKGKLTYVTVASNVKGILKRGFIIDHSGVRLDKPNGIWLSVDDGWEKWKEAEEFRTEDDAILQASILSDLKLLVIDSLDDFLSWQNDFDKEVGIVGSDDGMDRDLKRLGRTIPKEKELTSDFYKSKEIDLMRTFGIGFSRYNPKLWKWTASKVDGVFMTEKGQWATRMTTFMYGWDCATLLMFNEKHVKFSKPKFFLTTEQECSLCKGTGYWDLGKMHESMEKDMKKDGVDYKLPDIMKQKMRCPKCDTAGKLVISSRIKERDW